ncbi:MAG: ATP-binding protein [Planctomycetota bacterium]|nr:ATP-binding protein [Planctomycetota bacterium]
MTPFGRGRFLGIVAVMCLLVAAGTTAMFVRSYWRNDRLCIGSGGGRVTVHSEQGKFWLSALPTYEPIVRAEAGYLPIDKRGADLLSQILSQRYECGSIVLATNKVFKHWPSIFNNDATLTSAILDRILQHAKTIVIEGKSYHMKDRVEP